ncbi:radical SAM family heme chaperone HemW [Occallatibacter riparius]|uniref:Heme chaperone HemW n=1 Tax=Occallatibacter riparius TaxID=1002689 RepID=A0A9J7BVX0_9BACT|nr:radical SAM family heme chaperone HemW [Occallatibacter riparius]
MYPASEHARYIARVIEEVTGARNWAEKLALDLPHPVDTIYLGGGTPSLLEPELFERLFGAIRRDFDVAADAEITVECAPGQLPQATLDAMASAGVNRVSLGVQSFIDKEAHESGRLHGRAIVLDDLRRLRASGISNLNVDLIAGLAGQTFASWDESLGVLLDSGVPHASVYMLEVDEDSRLGRELMAGGARYRAGLVPTDDAIAQMYETAISRLESAGLKQYEISNFAQPGSESRHNLRYWQRRPYLGLGLDASSMLRDREGEFVLRATTTDDLKGYLEGDTARETAWLGPERQVEEAWFLGLRTNAGVDPSELEEEFGTESTADSVGVAEGLVGDGLLTQQEGRFRLTPRGRLISNDIFQEFLAETGHEALGTSG